MSVTKAYLFETNDFKIVDGCLVLKRKYGSRKRNAIIIEIEKDEVIGQSKSIPFERKVTFK